MPPPRRQAPAFTEASEMKNAMVALMLGMGLVVLGAGCSKEEEKGGEKGGGEKMGASSAGESLGVAECDAYFKAIDGCKDAAVKSGLQQGAKALHDGWKASLQAPGGKDTVKMSCKTATDAVVASCKE
jgi:hypothetical protein